MGEALDMEEKKKEGESAFVKIFKILLSCMMFIGVAKYAIGGGPEKKDMRFMTENSRAAKK